MEVSEILKQFEVFTGKFPRAAVEEAIERREEITPKLLRILEEILDSAEQSGSGKEYNAHLYALYLLAQFRETRAYPLVVRLALLPEELLDNLCGDFVTEALSRVLASVCDGDLGGIKSIIENPQADEWARSAALSALVTLVEVGEKSRDETISYFATLFRGGLERQESYAWTGLVHCCYELWPGELLGDIERAYAHGLVDRNSIRMEDVRRAFDLGIEGCRIRLARDTHRQLVADTVKEYGSWACFRPKKERPDSQPPPELDASYMPIKRDGPKIGRNDPCPCGSGKKYKKCCLQ
jgi:hypothetical protein